MGLEVPSALIGLVFQFRGSDPTNQSLCVWKNRGTSPTVREGVVHLRGAWQTRRNP